MYFIKLIGFARFIINFYVEKPDCVFTVIIDMPTDETNVP